MARQADAIAANIHVPGHTRGSIALLHARGGAAGGVKRQARQP